MGKKDNSSGLMPSELTSYDELIAKGMDPQQARTLVLKYSYEELREVLKYAKGPNSIIMGLFHTDKVKQLKPLQVGLYRDLIGLKVPRSVSLLAVRDYPADIVQKVIDVCRETRPDFKKIISMIIEKNARENENDDKVPF